jgi:beta-mannosidase
MIKRLILTLMTATILASSSAEVIRKELHEGWTVRQARGLNSYPANVPGTVHTDLMAAGLIDDPFIAMNERACQWIDKEDWIYRTSFSVPREIYKKSRISLIFKGLDTYAEVYLNDSLVLKADNMFCEWTIDCKSLLKLDSNSLRIYFHSPIKVDLPKLEALPYRYEAGNDQSENGGLLDKRVSVFARKAGYHYGWDWGPRLVTSGIWRPVYIEGWDAVRIEDVWIRTSNVSQKSADILSEISLLSEFDTEVSIKLIDQATGKIHCTSRAKLVKGDNTVPLSFKLNNPRLWWTNGLGEQFLYEFKVSVSDYKGLIDETVKRVGVRSLQLVREDDKDGKGASFRFELNGIQVFMKGANYIPSDNFLPRVSDENYTQLLQNAKAAGMNMLRVWGGGIYENDLFYELCDEYGIAVWQDFMFACSMYPADEGMQKKIRLEAEQNIKRLRSHPCIALWCGNNEMNDAWYNWGWKRAYERRSKEIADKIWDEYLTVFHGILPDAVKAFDPDRSYWPSSPLREPGAEGTYDSQRSGDLHYWGVWHAEAPVTDYAKVIPRFMSEYGFQSFPEFGSVKKYVPKAKDYDIFSDVMLAHQRNPRGNGLIKRYMEANYKSPSDFATFLYVSGLLQADAIKIAQEAHRRNMPYCMGSLYWQLNDCWPVASWSSTDYYGRPKALYYFTRRAFAPVLVSPYEDDGNLTVHLVSDLRHRFNGRLTVRICNFAGKAIYEKVQSLVVEGCKSKKAFEQPVSALLGDMKREEVFVHVILEEGDRTVAENTLYLALQKDINFPESRISKKISRSDEGYTLTLNTDLLARAVYLSIDDSDDLFSDNYFDLIPGRTVSIKLKTKLHVSELEKRLKVIRYK